MRKKLIEAALRLKVISSASRRDNDGKTRGHQEHAQVVSPNVYCCVAGTAVRRAC
jgi:hypothetical protein